VEGMVGRSRLPARFGPPLHPVGRITDGRELEWFENGTLRPLDWHGFTHY